MDIAALSIVMNQSKVQQDAGIAVMKMAMDAGKETAAKITDMIETVAVDPNRGRHIDIKG
ncbi:MAG: putative motility protein [Peptoclostridium sp.]|uniref:YjfB family protein n=1 Tax=Peptoclostridium sp. TaxID=1904860 RepID=UPI00139C3D88|nr:YjfB family protein [Peptoclostridium sp.]MZQ75869.1 putative motility protein [Peptoclostridium sp.]